MGRLLGRLWVGFTTSLITFIAYSSQIFIIWPWYGHEFSVELLALLLPFNILVGMLYWNYYLCVVTDPGRVPKSWEPDIYSGEAYEVKRLTGGPRQCRTCNTFKPPRAHHCRECRRCVLRMDHHCPWVNNCVGHFNYGHFIRFLFFVDLACSYHLTMVTKRTFAALASNYWDQPDTLEFIMIILNFTTCVPVLLAVGAFSIYHFYCLLSNTTTIEGWEKDKVATLVKKGKIHEVKFPYDLGKKQNLMSVLGSNPLFWCWPTVPPGTGLKFRVAEQDDHSPGVDWPPEDPTRYNPHTASLSFDDSREIVLPESPWTYENGSLNPNLHPSNAYQRASKVKKTKHSTGLGAVSDVPPYHPDYVPPAGSTHAVVESDDDGYSSSPSDQEEYTYSAYGHRVRRGSEGLMFKPMDREEILRRYIMARGEEAGHYNRYVPEPHSPSEDDEGDEDVPLAQVASEFTT